MMTDTPESVTLVPIERIEVLNSRDRNMKVFEEIVENIRSIGLKKPITVTEREGADGASAYLLVCGEPLSVIKPDPDAAGFLLLDGNLRVLALKELGQDRAGPRRRRRPNRRKMATMQCQTRAWTDDSGDWPGSG